MIATDRRDYAEFLASKQHRVREHGFESCDLPAWLFPFQSHLVDWALRMGRAAIFADCGLGKTPMQLAWADGVCRRTGGRAIIVTPLAVGPQTVREGQKFGIECDRSSDGSARERITVTNYERLHHFDPADFDAVVCDESSAIKQFGGARQRQVTDFCRNVRYRLLCTATAAPNDHIEFGTSSEALGYMGRMDMLSTFFKSDENSLHPTGFRNKWLFKAHAEKPFWRWLASWSRAVRLPSDLGYLDNGFMLPALAVQEHIVENRQTLPGRLFAVQAITEEERREERRLTMRERCEKVAELCCDREGASVAWAHLNDEADLIQSLVPGAVQVKGSDSDEFKEEAFRAFAAGEILKLVTKPSIGAFGLNWQHCAHMTVFPSHSFEQYYQCVRRFWRFGQTSAVTVDMVTSEGEVGVVRNLERKAAQADAQFANLVAHMAESYETALRSTPSPVEVPSWIK